MKLILMLIFTSSFTMASGPSNITGSLSGLSNKHNFSCPEQIIKKENPDVIFIGENHWDDYIEDFFSENLSFLHSFGFEYFFAEYIESNDQHIIDKFYKDPRKNLNWFYSTFASHQDWGYNPQKYLNISLDVVKSGMKLMGFDRRRDIEHIRDKDYKMMIRDQHMLEVAEKFIKKNPGKKLIFFNGWSHSFVHNQLMGPSFYELFIRRFPQLKTMNLRRDFYDDMTNQRLNLSRKYDELDNGCEKGFLFYKDPANEEFDYHIFEEEKPLFPISDSAWSDLA